MAVVTLLGLRILQDMSHSVFCSYCSSSVKRDTDGEREEGRGRWEGGRERGSRAMATELHLIAEKPRIPAPRSSVTQIVHSQNAHRTNQGGIFESSTFWWLGDCSAYADGHEGRLVIRRRRQHSLLEVPKKCARQARLKLADPWATCLYTTE